MEIIEEITQQVNRLKLLAEFNHWVFENDPTRSDALQWLRQRMPDATEDLTRLSFETLPAEIDVLVQKVEMLKKRLVK
jgi:hypothetical protein